MVSFGVVDEPGALASEIGVDLVQRVPQLARRNTGRAMTAFTLEDMHDLADPLETELRILGFAIPDSPMQAFDLRDDRCLRSHPTRLVGRQTARRLLRVLQSHGDVEPVCDWWRRDTGLGQNRVQTRAAIGERGHRGVGGSASCLQAPRISTALCVSVL